MEPFETIEATYRPARTDDLKPGVADYIGKTTTWTALWLITEQDGGPYVGRLACAAYEWTEFPAAWVPDCDLAPLPPRQ